MSDRNEASRRRFLKFLVGSPLSRYAPIPGTVFGQRSIAWGADGPPAPSTEITSPAQALNVFDLEEVARKKLPPAYFAYLATGVEADATLRANREGFAKFQIRARRLVDTSRIDASVKLFGTAWPTPIVLAPVSSLRAFHPWREWIDRLEPRRSRRRERSFNHRGSPRSGRGNRREDSGTGRQWFSSRDGHLQGACSWSECRVRRSPLRLGSCGVRPVGSGA